MVIDQEDDREGDGQRTSLTGRSTNQHSSQGYGRQAQMESCYAHRQPFWKTALHDDCLRYKHIRGF